MDISVPFVSPCSAEAGSPATSRSTPGVQVHSSACWSLPAVPPHQQKGRQSTQPRPPQAGGRLNARKAKLEPPRMLSYHFFPQHLLFVVLFFVDAPVCTGTGSGRLGDSHSVPELRHIFVSLSFWVHRKQVPYYFLLLSQKKSQN